MRLSTAVAWSVFSITVLLAAAGLVLFVLDLGTPIPESAIGFSGQAPLLALVGMGMAFASVGLLISTRRPENSIGWMFLAVGLLALAEMAAFEYAVFGLLARPGAVPLPELAGWLYAWSGFVGGTITGVFVTLYFPTGRLPSRRWLPVTALGALAALSGWFVLGFAPGRVVNAAFVANPLGVDVPADLVLWIGSFALAAVSVSFALAVVSLVVRYIRASSDERQQIKWYAYAAGLHAVVFTTYGVSFSASELVTAAVIVAAGIPIAAGIAILRHRLYDIDVVINRTIVYGAVSVVLLGTYAAAIVLFQALLRPFTAGSDLAVAISTLLVVALFQPVRRRVQNGVDRRFYRSRYDAARTLDAFTARLRNEVDIDSVRTDLLEVIGDTVRPAHASVWLRERP